MSRREGPFVIEWFAVKNWVPFYDENGDKAIAQNLKAADILRQKCIKYLKRHMKDPRKPPMVRVRRYERKQECST